jgi:hypothetical protein
MVTGPETEYLGGRKAKIWTYLIFAVLLVAMAIVANVAIKDPDVLTSGVQAFLGLPRWAFPVIAGALGLVIYWFGLRIETDWPEALGAFLVAGAVAAAQFMLGWDRFAIGGLAVIPYAIPVLVFVILLMVGIVKSR